VAGYRRLAARRGTDLFPQLHATRLAKDAATSKINNVFKKPKIP
jgi:hypothetical protein